MAYRQRVLTFRNGRVCEMALKELKTKTAILMAIGVVIAVSVGGWVGYERATEDGALPILKGAYLGVAPPSTVPQPFLPELFSSDKSVAGFHLHSSLYFSPDGSEVLFTNQSLPPEPGRSQTIISIRRNGGVWGVPEPVSFSSEFSDQTGWFSLDGSRFYFGSVRPLPGDSVSTGNLQWWIVGKQADGWSPARHISSPADLTVDDGPIYIPMASQTNLPSLDIHRCVYSSEGYGALANIGSPPNSSADDYPVLVGPGEEYLIIYRFDSKDRSGCGLYVSFSCDSGWTIPKRMGDDIGPGFDASLSPDGGYLFYLRRNDGVYWVRSDIIDYLRSEDLNLVDTLHAVALCDPAGIELRFNQLRQKHRSFYRFDERCLQAVFKRLIMAGEVRRAAAVERTNARLFPAGRSVVGSLLTFAVEGHHDSLKTLIQALRGRAIERGDATEGNLNRLGYIFLRADLLDEAVAIFELNVDLNPGSFNTYDSYAEGLARLGRLEQAIANYERSLELNGENNNAVRMIEEIKKQQAISASDSL